MLQTVFNENSWGPAMSLLIAQIGDIHLRDNNDATIAEGPLIGAAISAEISIGTAAVALIICGDAADKGSRTQFEAATRFVEGIRDVIGQKHGGMVIHTVVVPGNHDCDFSDDQEVRNIVLDKLREESTGGFSTPSAAVLETVMAPLHHFFHFAETISSADFSITSSSPFYNCVTLSLGDKQIRLHLLNTAWMSSRHEAPGSLYFPLDSIIVPSGNADCDVAIMHHPLNWFSQPHVMRPLREQLERLASVVLTGHEHVSEAATLSRRSAERNVKRATIYIGGGVVREPSEPALCTFNTICLSLDQNTVLAKQHQRTDGDSGNFFETTVIEDCVLSRPGQLISSQGLRLSESMSRKLDDPGAPITHPDRDPRTPIRLSDFYVYPDLWDVDSDNEGANQKQIKSREVEQEVLSGERVLITGGEKSGRSSLAKRLYHGAFIAGKAPLLLRGDQFPRRADDLRKTLGAAVLEQYEGLTAAAYEQLPKGLKVVLVDDVHRLSPATADRKALLESLESSFDSVILCGDDFIKFEGASGSHAKDSGIWEYRHLSILGFGEVLREEFVRRWLSLGTSVGIGSEVTDSQVDSICELLNLVVRKQLLPTYPLYLLVILQQTDLTNASVKNGSYGDLFQALLTIILGKSSFNRLRAADKQFYLAALSKEMYDLKTMSLPIEQARRWHKNYWDNIEIDIDFDRLIEDLASLNILSRDEASVNFKYVYFFCYYVAYHLNQNIHDQDSRAIVRQLSKQLHHRVSAEIVLFLAHLTGDPIVLDAMVDTCDSLFAEIPQATLAEDVQALNHLGEVVQTIQIHDSPDENRRAVKERYDEVLTERLTATTSDEMVAAPEATDDAIRRLFEIHAAYKTIQILGQALRNIAGSAGKQRKEEIIQKIVGLSRRMLGLFLQSFTPDALPDVMEELAAIHKEQQPDLATSELHNQVCRHLNGLIQFIAFSIFKHTSKSIGSEHLAPTVNRLLGESNELPSRLIDLSFTLDRPKGLHKDGVLKLHRSQARNHFAGNVVRMLVAHHMYLFNVDYKVRQAVCDKLDIDLQPSVHDRGRKKLLK